MKHKILIIEDDGDIVNILKLYLENEGLEVLSASDGEIALNIINNNKIDIVVIDIMIPKINGYDVIKKVREYSAMPIIIISAKSLDSDKILGLNLGADDYITKPFNPLEVSARVKALLRRCYNFNILDEKNSENVIKINGLELNTETFSVKKLGREVILTPTEYKILYLLMKSPGRVYTKVQIYETIKGEYFKSDENTLMVHISKLRDKIEDNPKEPNYIKTIRGLGYRFEKR